jgi:AAA ATPase domain
MEAKDPGRAALLEHTHELEELSQLVEAAGAGAGRMVVLEGPAGIGKTSLLSACGRAAAESGMVLMEARGDRLAMESSFAAVRELRWRQVELAGVDALEGAARHAAPVFDSAPTVVVDPDQTARVLHGLYWLVASLAEGAAVAHTAVSDCRFDYGTTSAYGNSFPCEQSAGDGVSPVGVSADLGPGTMSGPLTPATTYHFRVVATNLGGTSYGADETFTTRGGAPAISATHAVSVTQNSARRLVFFVRR